MEVVDKKLCIPTRAANAIAKAPGKASGLELLQPNFQAKFMPQQ